MFDSPGNEITNGSSSFFQEWKSCRECARAFAAHASLHVTNHSMIAPLIAAVTER